MKIKLKDICVDINKPRSIEALKQLQDVCKTELKESEGSKKDFLLMLIPLIEKKLLNQLVCT